MYKARTDTESPTFSPVMSVTPSKFVCPLETWTGTFTAPFKPPRKLGNVEAETLKNGLAGAMETAAVTLEKRRTTEFVFTKTLEFEPAVGLVTCIRTVCPENTFVLDAK